MKRRRNAGMKNRLNRKARPRIIYHRGHSVGMYVTGLSVMQGPAYAHAARGGPPSGILTRVVRSSYTHASRGIARHRIRIKINRDSTRPRNPAVSLSQKQMSVISLDVAPAVRGSLRIRSYHRNFGIGKHTFRSPCGALSLPRRGEFVKKNNNKKHLQIFMKTFIVLLKASKIQRNQLDVYETDAKY